MAITNARMQMRRGNEQDYDPAKMLPGEWAVSLDTKYVRMCFAPGECLRMATYEAFEQDMAEIMRILTECRDIRTAVELIRDNVAEAELVIEDYVAQARQYRDEAEQFRNEAFATTPDGYADLVQNVADNTVKIDTIIEKAELNIKNTASGETIHLTDSADSKVLEFGLYGKAEQNGTPTPDAPVDIEVAGASGSVEVKSGGGKNHFNDNYEKVKSSWILPGGSSIYKKVFTLEPNTFYTLSCAVDNIGANARGAFCFVVTGSNIGFNPSTSINGAPVGNPRTVKTDSNGNLTIGTYLVAPEDSTVTVDTANIQLEKGEVATPYEPYTETTATISTPEGIAGINGVYDEIVKYADGSGKRIQRIGKEVISGVAYKNISAQLVFGKYQYCWSVPRTNIPSNYRNPLYVNSMNKPFMSNLGEYIWVGNSNINIETDMTLDEFNAYMSDKSLIILYEFETPIITDLTAEEIAEIEKLHTFYPVTNISNDSDCGMTVTYLADSKNYIDNQLAIQAQAQEEALLNMLLLMPESVQASMIENETNNLLNEAEV